MRTISNCRRDKWGLSVLTPYLTILLFVLIWQALVDAFSIPRYLVPSPQVVVMTIFDQMGSLLTDTLVTLLEAVLGFITGTSLAFLVGILFVRSPLLERSMSPLFISVQAVPLIAISPLLIIWFGNGLTSKVAMAAITCFFPMAINTAAGLKSINLDSMALMRVMSASKAQIFWKLRMPSALPYIFTGLKISSTLSVIGAIVAELAGATRGIGYQILMSSYQTDTPMLFAAVIFSSISGMIFFKTVVFVEAMALRNRRR